MHYLEFLPFLVERLEDLATNSSHAKVWVNLIFLIKKGTKIKSKSIPRRFEYAMIPKWLKMGFYNKLDYWMCSIKLQMEFYIEVLELFCDPRFTMYLVFIRSKFVCTTWLRWPSLMNLNQVDTKAIELDLRLSAYFFKRCSCT